MKRIIAFVLALIMIMGLGVTAFAEDCAVTFIKLNNQIINVSKVVKGTQVGRPLTDPQRDGYEFVAWCLNSEDGDPWDFDTPVTENINLYAKWAINKYTVSFNAQGHGTAPETQNVDYNTFATRPENPSAEGWHFDDWYSDNDLNNKFEFTTPITETTTLFAKWLQTHKVTFEIDNEAELIGLANKPTDKNIIHNEKVTKPSPDPSAEGYTFMGWYKDKDRTTPWDFDNDVVKADDTKIYAKWEIKKYTVSFDMKGLTDVTGAPADITAVEHGSTVTRPETDPSKTGYVFVNWYKESTFENLWDFDSDTISGNTVIYAKWIKLIDKPTASLKTYTYTGSEQTYDIPAVDGEYTVSGNKGTAVGSYTATYTLADKDNTAWNEAEYPTDDVTIDWSIEKVTVIPGLNSITCTFGDSEDDILSAAKNQFYEGNNVAIDPDDISFKYKNEPAGESEEFKTGVPTAVGTYKLVVVVKDSKNYNGYNSDIIGNTLTINPKEIDIIWADTAFVYNGKDQTAAIEAKFKDINGKDIFLDVDVTGGKFKNAGTYTVTAKLRNGYENYKLPSSAATSYTIAPKDISGATVELGDALIYNGKSQTQTVKKVTVDGLEATYTVSGNIQKEVGTYTLTVTGTGNFSGTATKQFVIIPDKNYHYKVNKYGDIEIGDGEISFNDYNEKHMPEISIAGDKGDLVEMLVKMGKITSDDLVRIANGETLNIMLETQKTYVSDRVWDKIEKRAGNKEIDSYFDIEFYLYWNGDTENRTDITDTSGYGYITVEVEAPDLKHAKSRSYSVIRYHNDGYRGHAVELSAKYDSKRETLTFRTNQFSVYAIAYSDVRDDDDDGKIVINGKDDKKKDDKKKDINPNTGALVF